MFYGHKVEGLYFPFLSLGGNGECAWTPATYLS